MSSCLPREASFTEGSFRTRGRTVIVEDRTPRDWLVYVEDNDERSPLRIWGVLRRLCARMDAMHEEIVGVRRQLDEIQQQAEKRPPEYYADRDEFERDLNVAFATCAREYLPINAHTVGKSMPLHISANTVVKRLRKHGYLKPGDRPAVILKRLAEPFRNKHGLLSLLPATLAVKVVCVLLKVGELGEFRRMLNDF